MTDRQKKENWEKVRAKGFVRFVLEVGFLRFALPTVILTQIIMYVLDHGLTTSRIAGLFTEPKISSFLVGLLVAGLLGGTVFWVVGERNYRKLNP